MALTINDLIEMIDLSFGDDGVNTRLGKVTWEHLKASIVNLEENCGELEEMNNCLEAHVKQLQEENTDLRSQLIKRW